jgi:D-glycero-alpha-D-manno-heptose-7-phosphate kinase
MIITKTPFRISFCGGGSDLPSFYEKHGGCVVSTSINKYMYIAVHPYFDPRKTVIKYSQTEIVDALHEIKHTIFHQVLNELQAEGIEITCTADIPAGTGLGSSSTFTVGLLHTLYCYKGKYVSKPDLAARACEVEIEKLGSPIGKQDQYAAALGGLNFIRFHANGSVTHESLLMKRDAQKSLESSLCAFYLGTTRPANEILLEQNKNMKDAAKAENLVKMCGLTVQMRTALINGDLTAFGEILHESWHLKRELASGISNPEIDDLYSKAIKAGAIGGKLLGAGGGGFLLFCCPEEKQPLLSVTLGLRPLPFAFDSDGTSVIYVGDKYWDA